MDLRQKKLQERRALTAEEAAEKSAAVCQNLLALPQVRQARVIFTYLSYGTEVSLWALHEELWRQGKRLAVPVCDAENKGWMEAVELTPESMVDLRTTSLGVREPRDGVVLDAAALDLALVPGVVFDRSGNRMGHGMGYYDRYLPRLNASAETIGIAYEFQVVEHLTPHSWDYALDGICTEKGFRLCRSVGEI